MQAKWSLYLRNIDLAVWPPGGTHYFGTQLELHALLLKNPLEIFGDFHIDAHPTNVAQELNCCHFGAQSVPHGTL